MTCIFCDIAAGRSGGDILYRDEIVTAFGDVAPRAPVHVLVIPNEHVPSAADLDAQHGPLLARMFEVARRVAEQAGIAESGYRLVFNVGRDAGQSVDHLHLHVLGGRRLGWPPG